jgi:hypothetical protein
MGGRRGAAEEELMSRPPHVCPNKGCRGYALGSDDEQEGAQHHRRRGDDALDGVRASGKRAIESTLGSLGFFVRRSIILANSIIRSNLSPENINPIFRVGSFPH